MPTKILEGPMPTTTVTSLDIADVDKPLVAYSEIGNALWRVLRLNVTVPRQIRDSVNSVGQGEAQPTKCAKVSPDPHISRTQLSVDRRKPESEPAQFAKMLVIAVLEVYAGIRPALQLAKWFAPPAFEIVQRQAALRQRLGTGSPHRTRYPLSSRASRPSATTAEATVLIREGERVRAVALRLQAHRERWRVTEFTIL